MSDLEKSFIQRLQQSAAEARKTTDLDQLKAALKLVRLHEEGKKPPTMVGDEVHLVGALINDPEWRKSVEERIALSEKQQLIQRLDQSAAEARKTTDLDQLKKALKAVQLYEKGKQPTMIDDEAHLVGALINDPEWRKSVETQIAEAELKK